MFAQVNDGLLCGSRHCPGAAQRRSQRPGLPKLPRQKGRAPHRMIRREKGKGVQAGGR